MENILITGATGFLGEYLVKQFRTEYCVYALGRDEGKGRLLTELGAVFCKGDFTKPNECEPYIKGMDFVIHAGALSTVWSKWEDFYSVNVDGTRQIGKLCLKHGVKRLVYISSPSIYTEKCDRLGIKEFEYDAKNTLNAYIESKILAEEVLKEFEKKGLYTVILRPRGLIGIGDTSLVPRLLKANLKMGIPFINGGQNMVDITCVENVAHACMLCLNAEQIKGEVFNITNGEPMEFKQILEEFLRAMKVSPHYLKCSFSLLYNIAAVLECLYQLLKITREPAITKYTVCTLSFSQTLDISKAEKMLGYRRIKSLSEGIKGYGNWWRQKYGKN